MPTGAPVTLAGRSRMELRGRGPGALGLKCELCDTEVEQPLGSKDVPAFVATALPVSALNDPSKCRRARPDTGAVTVRVP